MKRPDVSSFLVYDSQIHKLRDRVCFFSHFITRDQKYTSRGFNSTIGAIRELVRESAFLKDPGLELETDEEVCDGGIFDFFLYCGL